MINELLRLIYDYTVNGMVVDDNFVYEVITIVYNYKNLQYFLDSVYYENDFEYSILPEDALAQYDLSNKEMVINTNKLLFFKVGEVRKHQCYTAPQEELLQINLLMLQTILHELEHTEQYKKCCENKHDLEQGLLLISNERCLSSNEQKNMILNQLYKELYDVWPTERMADIKSAEIVSEITKNININSCYTRKLMYYYLLNYKLRGYQNFYNDYIICPNETLIITRNCSLGEENTTQPMLDLLKSETGKHYLDEKLFYGLTITIEEYYQVLNELMNTNVANQLVRK